MKLAVCIIAKNEEFALPRALASVKDGVDEMLVVDTGSTDATVEKAKEAGARVEYFEWINNFAAAKNYAMSQTDADIVIAMDADEWFDPPLSKTAAEELKRTFTNQPTLDAMHVPFTDYDREKGTTMGTSFAMRIFRNATVRYAGAIHEVPVASRENAHLSTWRVTDRYHMSHDGYSAAVVGQKATRNRALLEQAAEAATDDIEKAMYIIYLSRENYVNKNVAASYAHLQWLMQRPEIFFRAIRRSPTVGIQYAFLAMDIAHNMRFTSSRKQVHATVVDNLKKAFDYHPASQIAELYYDLYFDKVEGVILAELDRAAERGAALATDGIGELEFYQRGLMLLYTVAGNAALRRGNRELAFDYATKALVQTKAFVRGEIIELLLRCVRGLPFEDIVLFLNSQLSVDKRGTLEDLIKALHFEGYTDLYTYYLKKQLDNGWAKKADFWYLMIVLGKYEEAAEAAVAEQGDTDDETVQRILFLAIVCGGGAALLQKYEGKLGNYEPLLELFYHKKIAESMDFGLIVSNYQLIAFAGSRQLANNLLKSFKGIEKEAFPVQAAYYISSGLYAELIEEAIFTPANDDLTSQLYLAECEILAGRHADALQRLENSLLFAGPAIHTFNLLATIADAAPPDVATGARTLYERYHPLYEEWIDAEDLSHTQLNYDEDTKKSRRNLSQLTVAQFSKFIQPASWPPMAGQDTIFYRAAATHAQRQSYGAALRCLYQSLRYGFCTFLCYRLATSIFETLGNKAVAAECTRLAAQEAAAMTEAFNASLQSAAAHPPAELVQQMKDGFSSNLTPQNQGATAEYTRRYSFWGTLAPEENNYSLFENRADTLHAHAADIAWLYTRLANDASRLVLHAIVQNWLHLRVDLLATIAGSLTPEYFDKSLIPSGSGEVFVDLGARNGDTLRNFITTYGQDYGRIYCYEPNPAGFSTLTEMAKPHTNVVLRNVAAGAAPHSGEGQSQVVTLDQDIEEAITFLKVSVGGAEWDALQGAKSHIQKDQPKLAISLFHSADDLWRIPRLIDELCPTHRFYLSYHGSSQFPTRFTLLALPAETSQG